MPYRVLVLGAAGPAGMNFARAIREAGHTVIPSDADDLRLNAWYPAQDAIVTPEGRLDPAWLRAVVDNYDVDVVHSQPEGYVLDLAQDPPDYAHHLLPPVHDVLVTQDKFAGGIEWRRAGLRGSPILRIECDDDIRDAGETLGYPFWMRAARGAGARGATEVHNYDMGFHWWEYWMDRDDRPDWDFVAEEFLPGRDYAWTSLWYEGRLVTSTARERLQYMYPHLAPSGRTGTPVVAKIVHDRRVNGMAEEAVWAVSRRPHGVYCVDLRADREGYPRPTEINVGRFFTTSYHTAAMGVNFPDIYVRLAMGETVLERRYDALPDGLIWLRHIDCPGVVVHP